MIAEFRKVIRVPSHLPTLAKLAMLIDRCFAFMYVIGGVILAPYDLLGSIAWFALFALTAVCLIYPTLGAGLLACVLMFLDNMIAYSVSDIVQGRRAELLHVAHQFFFWWGMVYGLIRLVWILPLAAAWRDARPERH